MEAFSAECPSDTDQVRNLGVVKPMGGGRVSLSPQQGVAQWQSAAYGGGDAGSIPAPLTLERMGYDLA